MRRGLLLLAIAVAVLVVAPHAAADPTATTPAPDPNPPPGAAPDPYTPSPKPAPTRTVHHVYTPPVYVAPVHHVSTPAAAPVSTPRPTVVRHQPARAAKKTTHRTHRRHVVHHKQQPVVVRVTPHVVSYAATVVKTMGATVVAVSDDGVSRRRRAAGVGLAVLCATSFSLLLIAARSRRSRLS